MRKPEWKGNMCALWELLEFDMIFLLGYYVAVSVISQLDSSDLS